MIEIKSEVYLNDENFININTDNKNNHILYSISGYEIKRKDFKNFKVVCECGNSDTIKVLSGYLIDRKWSCRCCRNKGVNNGMYGKSHSCDIKLLMSELRSGEKNPFYGKHHSDETKNKISTKNKGKLIGDKNPMFNVNVYDYIKERYGEEEGEFKIKQLKEKLSLACTGDKNGFYGKKHSEETRVKLSESMKNSEKHKEASNSLITRQKISDKLKNRVFNESHRVNLRLSYIGRLNNFIKERCNITGEYMYSPNYNIKACEIFDNISKAQNINIRHAMNGGEYYIRSLGYWVDGYDVENNVVYEFDEKRHFEVNGELKERDKVRQTRIENLLGCKFIRIKYDEVN